MREIIIFIPSIEDGGVEKNLFLISNFLSKKALKVNLITANRDKRYKFSKSIRFISPQNNFFNKKNRIIKTIICFYYLIKFYTKNKNFLLFSFQANIYAIFFAYLFKIKIITRSNTAPGGWSKNIFKRFIFKIFFKYPVKIIANSLDFKRKLDKEFNLKTVCIYNPLDKKLIIQKKNKTLKFNFFKKNTMNIINIGRMTYQKNQIFILKVLNEIKHKINFRLLIIGKGKEKNNLKRFIIDNNLGNKVKLINFQKNPYPYLNKAEVFFLSSRFEGLPNVLLEAQLLKKTIISSNCPTGPKEILLNGAAGFLFNLNDKDKILKTLLFVANKRNKFFVERKKKIGFKKIHRFDFKKNMNKYYYLIKKNL